MANYGLWMFLSVCVVWGEQDERHDYDGMDYGEEAFARRDDPFGPRKIAYPPRLMVDFTSLGMRALQRYVAFYGLKLDEEYAQADLAALVARHFDRSLDVQEDDSIAAFVQRLRNGEKSGAKRAGDKERRAADKKRKKSNSRKRQREASASAASGSHASNGGGGGGGGHHSSHSNGSTASGSGSSGGHANGGGGHGSSSAATAHHESERKAPGGGGAKSKKPSAAASKKDNENEDNELYCICNLPSYGNMIACDGKKCPNPSQWYHLECVGLADGRHPDTWLCPECDPKGFAAFQSKKKKNKHRSKSPGAK